MSTHSEGLGGNDETGAGRGPADATTSRQLRRKQARRLRAKLARGPAQLAAESLETRALLAAVVADYGVAGDWGSGFQAGITLESQDAAAVENWTLSFDYEATIGSIWDAQVVSRDGSTYTIQGAGWNSDLAPGGKISFGFIGAPARRPTTRSTANRSASSRPLPSRCRRRCQRPHLPRRRRRSLARPIRPSRSRSRATGGAASMAI